MSITGDKPPYAQWLGRPAVGRISNLYELLGLPVGFQDVTIIAQVADGLIQRIRSVDPGQHAKAKAQMLVKLRHARSCLTDLDQKANYDARLNASSPSANASTSPPQDIPRAIPVAQPVVSPAVPPTMPQATPPVPTIEPVPGVAHLELRLEDRNITVRRRRRSSWAGLVWLWCLLVVIAMLAFILLATDIGQRVFSELRSAASQESNRIKSAENEEVTTGDPDTPVPVQNQSVVPQADNALTETAASAGVSEDHDSAEQDASEKKFDTSAPSGKDTTTDSAMPENGDDELAVEVPDMRLEWKATPLTAKEIAVLSETLAAAREAMRQRDLESARTSIESAREITVSGPLAERVAGLSRLLTRVQLFWKAVDSVMKTVEAGSAIQIGEVISVVVHSNSHRIAIKKEGQLLKFTLESMPIGLAVALIEFYEPDDQDGFALATGSAIAVDFDGSWEEGEEYGPVGGEQGQLRQAWEEDYGEEALARMTGN